MWLATGQQSMLQRAAVCPACGAARLESWACAPRAGPSSRSAKQPARDSSRGRPGSAKQGCGCMVLKTMMSASQRGACPQNESAACAVIESPVRRRGGFDPFRLTADSNRYALLRRALHMQYCWAVQCS